MLRGRIYAIKFEGKAIYVGQTAHSIERRLFNHLTVARTGSGGSSVPLLHQHMRDHAFTGYTVELLELVENRDRDVREKFWIERLKTRRRCNISPGGQSPSTSEYFYDDNSRRRRKFIARPTGQKLTEEHKAKIRAGWARVKHMRKDLRAVICIQTGQTWPSIQDCAREFGVTDGTIRYRTKHKMQRKSFVPALNDLTFAFC